MTHDTKGCERRQHDRSSLKMPVELFYDGEALGPYRSVDLSEGGVQIQGYPLPIQTRLKLHVRLDDGAGMLIDGTVAWRVIGRSGIEFNDLPPQARSQLREALSKALASRARG